MSECGESGLQLMLMMLTSDGELKQVLIDRFGHWDFVCYSTASSAVDRPKFRLVFNLVETVHRDRIPHFWYALNTEIGDIGDAQTKDLSVCTTSLQTTMVLTILFSVIQAVLLTLIIW